MLTYIVLLYSIKSKCHHHHEHPCLYLYMTVLLLPWTLIFRKSLFFTLLRQVNSVPVRLDFLNCICFVNKVKIYFLVIDVK